MMVAAAGSGVLAAASGAAALQQRGRPNNQQSRIIGVSQRLQKSWLCSWSLLVRAARSLSDGSGKSFVAAAAVARRARFSRAGGTSAANMGTRKRTTPDDPLATSSALRAVASARTPLEDGTAGPLQVAGGGPAAAGGAALSPSAACRVAAAVPHWARRQNEDRGREMRGEPVPLCVHDRISDNFPTSESVWCEVARSPLRMSPPLSARIMHTMLRGWTPQLQWTDATCCCHSPARRQARKWDTRTSTSRSCSTCRRQWCGHGRPHALRVYIIWQFSHNTRRFTFSAGYKHGLRVRSHMCGHDSHIRPARHAADRERALTNRLHPPQLRRSLAHLTLPTLRPQQNTLFIQFLRNMNNVRTRRLTAPSNRALSRLATALSS